jgi:hypothetical protein
MTRTGGFLRWLARLINAAMVGLLIASFALPDPRHLLTMTFMGLPWLFLVLVARYRPFYFIGGHLDEARVNFSQILAFPGLALLMHVCAIVRCKLGHWITRVRVWILSGALI